MMRINLLPTARRDALARLIRVRRWTVSLGTGTAVLAVVLAGARAAWPDERTRLRTEQTALEAMRDDLMAQVSSLKIEVRQKSEALRAASKIGDEPDWSILLALVADRTQRHIVLTSLSLEPSERSPDTPASTPTSSEPPSRALVLDGVGTSAHQVSLFSVRLEQLGLFERVVIEKSERSQTGQLGSIAFTIRCRLPQEDD
jgi:Fimbrial assembly protein (PilN)